MVCLFENWAALTGCEWVPGFLSSCGINGVQSVTAIGWSYEYTQDRPKKTPRKLTADIVFYWQDEQGDAILVLETKKPGNRTWSDKDMPSKGIYTDVPGYEGINRRFACLVISEKDKVCEQSRLLDEPVLTWEQLASLQMKSFTQQDLPEPTKSFMVGALIHQYASYNIAPSELPYDWLKEQPDALQIRNTDHSGSERRASIWRRIRQSTNENLY